MKQVISEKRIDQLSEEATVDAYGEDEQLTGFHCLLEEHLHFPFVAKVIGETVDVTGVDIGDRSVMAICERNGQTYQVDILNLVCDWFSIHGGDALIAFSLGQKETWIYERLICRAVGPFET